MQEHAFTIYNASAGSGKTFTLVKEYLKIVLQSSKDDAYKNILAITFTNKAVGEMKSRIVESLSEFAKDQPSAKAVSMMDAIQVETGLSFGDIQAKAKQIIKHIIHNYASFDISTIDKFTHKVIRAFAHDLQLPSTFEVSLETDSLLQESVDAIIAQAGENDDLTKLLIDFTMEKTDDDKSWDVTRDFFTISKLLVNENNRNEIVHFQSKSISEFLNIKQTIIQQNEELQKTVMLLGQKALDLISKHHLSTSSFYSGYVPKHFSKIASGNIGVNIGLFKYLEEGKRYSSKTALTDKTAIDDIAPKLAEYLTEINALTSRQLLYVALLKNITPLSLLNTINNELQKIQKEKNVLSIAEFNAIIHNEIQNQPAPFIYERMGERYKHFFIDEFQDTSEMQWENLIPLIDNALSSEDLSGERGTLMLVGDPKQSIYRWRGGKAEQFIALTKNENPFVNPDKLVKSLGTNYRSYSEVIEFNNDFFKVISSEFLNPDYKELYEKYSFQQSTSKRGGYVSLSFIPKTEKSVTDEEEVTRTDLYLEATLNTINKVLEQGFLYKDIVVLTRKKSAGIAVAGFLTEKNILIVSSETLLLGNSTEVQLVIYVLHFLNNGKDKEAKAYFLQYISNKIQTELAVHDFILQGMTFVKEEDLEIWLKSFDVAISFKNIRQKSLYEAVEIIIAKFIRPRQSHAYLQYFLDIVLERALKNQLGISDFLQFWEDNSHKFSIPSPEGNNAVRIMTVHKSKGLEFPVVIFPFAEEDYTRTPKDKLWIDNVSADLDFPKLLIDNSSSVETFGTAAAEIYQQKKQEELLDNVNVLYVALTRAEEQLYVISGMNIKKDGLPNENNMSAFFIKYLQYKQLFNAATLRYEFGKVEKKSLAREEIESIKTIPFLTETLQGEAIKIARREALMWGTTQQDAIEYGNLVHEILAYIYTVDEVSLAVIKAQENGLIMRQQSEVLQETLHRIISHEELCPFFDKNARVFNEQIIIQKNGGILKPDRMVIHNNNDVYLLDYKTGAMHSKYKVQLESYEMALKNMGYKVVKKTLVFIGKEIKVVNL